MGRAPHVVGTRCRRRARVEGLPPHPYTSRIGGAVSIVLRAGGNAHVFTTALGAGYVGSWPREDPWIRWLGHLVGGRIVGS